MQLTFVRKSSGVQTARVSEDLELALLNAHGGNGWSVVLRNAETRKIAARLGSCLRTVGEARTAAEQVTSSPEFGVALLKLAWS